MLWDAEQSDRHPSRSLGTCIAHAMRNELRPVASKGKNVPL